MTVLKYDDVIKKVAWPSLGCYFAIFWKILCSVTFMQKLSALDKKIILLFPEMRVTENIFIRATAKKKKKPKTNQKKKKNQFNWIFKIKFTLKNYSNSTFLCWKTKSPIFHFLKGKKRKLVRINLLVDFFLFVCVCFFLNNKFIFSYTFDLCQPVGDIQIFTRPIAGNKTTFFLALGLTNSVLINRSSFAPPRLFNVKIGQAGTS